MGRLNFALITPALCVLGLVFLDACTPQDRSAANRADAPQSAAGLQDGANLIGATPVTLQAEFGQPSLLRVDGKAQVWLYHSASCGLNLILYPDASGTPRVAMAMTADGNPLTDDCSASLQQSHIDALSNMPAAQPAGAALEPPAAS